MSAPGAVRPDSGNEATPFVDADGSEMEGTMSSRREVAASSLRSKVSGMSAWVGVEGCSARLPQHKHSMESISGKGTAVIPLDERCKIVHVGHRDKGCKLLQVSAGEGKRA